MRRGEWDADSPSAKCELGILSVTAQLPHPALFLPLLPDVSAAVSSSSGSIPPFPFCLGIDSDQHHVCLQGNRERERKKILVSHV